MTSKKRNQQIILIVAAVVVVAALVLLGIKFFGGGEADNGISTTGNQTTLPTTQGNNSAAVNPLTGIGGYDQKFLDSRPVAVIISNAPAARPQWGLSTPDILVEGLVEGGVTRMLGFYANVSEIPDKIGPIRSARHDFIEFAQGFDAFFIHWGGSTYAYNALRNKSRHIDNVDGMAGTYFHRDKNRTNVGIEHRGYTTGSNIERAINDKKFRTEIKGEYKSPLSLSPEGSPITYSGGACQSIKIEFSGSFKHKFVYDPEKKLYFNYFNGNAMNDANGKQSSATNVIVLYCGIKSMHDKKGCIDMDLSSGSGIAVSNGTYQNITWKKGGYDDALKLYAPDGKALTLNAGKSYIGLVPTTKSSNTVIE